MQSPLKIFLPGEEKGRGGGGPGKGATVNEVRNFSLVEVLAISFQKTVEIAPVLCRVGLSASFTGRTLTYFTYGTARIKVMEISSSFRRLARSFHYADFACARLNLNASQNITLEFP